MLRRCPSTVHGVFFGCVFIFSEGGKKKGRGREKGDTKMQVGALVVGLTVWDHDISQKKKKKKKKGGKKGGWSMPMTADS